MGTTEEVVLLPPHGFLSGHSSIFHSFIVPVLILLSHTSYSLELPLERFMIFWSESCEESNVPKRYSWAARIRPSKKIE